MRLRSSQRTANSISCNHQPGSPLSRLVPGSVFQTISPSGGSSAFVSRSIRSFLCRTAQYCASDVVTITKYPNAITLSENRRRSLCHVFTSPACSHRRTTSGSSFGTPASEESEYSSAACRTHVRRMSCSADLITDHSLGLADNPVVDDSTKKADSGLHVRPLFSAFDRSSEPTRSLGFVSRLHPQEFSSVLAKRG